MQGTEVNPMVIQKNDEIAVSAKATPENVGKTRTVKKVEACTRPEFVHLDGQCYDSRFSVIIRKNK